ncbi:hypothetical protein D918_00226 [Trichuris suis]|nr:hypothetical protein D918_00226 [Trichuris suis]
MKTKYDRFYWRVTEAHTLLVRPNGDRIISVQAKETICPTQKSLLLTSIYAKACPIAAKGKGYDCFIHYNPNTQKTHEEKTKCVEDIYPLGQPL